MDAKIIQVALSGLENILRLGQQEAQTRSGPNSYAILIEECYGKFSLISWKLLSILLLYTLPYVFAASFNIFCIFSLHTGLDKIEFLQSHENMEIYQKAFDIIETYFGSEEEDTKLAPSVDAQGQQFNFNPDQQQQPSQGFEFWSHFSETSRGKGKE